MTVRHQTLRGAEGSHIGRRPSATKFVGGSGPTIAGGCPMEDEQLVRGVDRRQQLEVEPNLAEVLGEVAALLDRTVGE